MSSPDLPFDPRRERAWPWLLALAGSGMLLAALPHLISAVRSGDPGYIADGDALLYLAWSRDAVRHGSWALTDAIHRPSGPMMHPWLLFVPPALVAHVLGIGMSGLAVVWPLIGGAAVALGLYAAVRPFTTKPRAAAGLAAFLLFDTGLLFGQIVQRDAEIVLSLARGSRVFLEGVPRIMAHLRVPPPALAIPFLLGHFALVHRARSQGTRRSAVVAGVSLGLLFHAYFYFATAAFAGAMLAWVVDRGGRRSYAWMIGVGLILAAPAVVAGVWIKASTPPDWLLRTGKFVPVDRFDRALLLFPKVLVAEWLALAVIVFRSRRDLLYLWCCTGTGLALANQHVVSGMDLEDFHWMFAYGLPFSLVIALIALPWLARRNGWLWAAPAILGAQIVVGFGLRGVEAVATAETNRFRALRDRWRGEGLALPPRAVVAGPENLLFLLAALEEIDPLACRLVEYSAAATDLERDERSRLNRVLTGATLDERSDDATARHLDAIAADPSTWVERFGVTHVLAAADAPPPKALTGLARRLARGRTWDLWRIEPPRRALSFPGNALYDSGDALVDRPAGATRADSRRATP